MDEEREYVRAMLELMRRIAEEQRAIAEQLGPRAGPADLHEATREIPWRYLAELEALAPPPSLVAFHEAYVAHTRDSLAHPPERLGTSQRLLMPEGHKEREARSMELLRVLFAVATDEEVEAAGFPKAMRWGFVVEDQETPREVAVRVEKDTPDWKEKLRAELERRGMPARDIDEVIRRLEQRGEDG